MTEHEKKFLKWKEDTRREALEMEVDRLNEENRRKHSSIKKLKTSFIMAGVILIATYAFLFFELKDKGKELQTSGPQSISSLTEDSLFNDQGKNLPKNTENRQMKITAHVRDTVLLKIPPDGILFSVQIGAYLGKDLSEYDKNMISLHQNSASGINQFTLGVFPEYNDAKLFQDKVLRLGFNDTYITAMKNGKRINTQKALKLKQKENTSSTIP